MLPTIEELRNYAHEAQTTYKSECDKIEQEISEQDRPKHLAELRARCIIAEISDRLIYASRAGNFSTPIMRLQYTCDYALPNPHWFVLEPSMLRGAGKIVYDYCVENHLSPTLDFSYSWQRRHSFFAIVLNWDPEVLQSITHPNQS